MKNFQTKIVEKIKTHILGSELFSGSGVSYETMQKNVVKPDRPEMTIQ
jgi:hypothetical protein